MVDTQLLSSTMENVKLVFPSLLDLWEFTQISNSNCGKIIIEDKYLECVCSKEALILAVKIYKATIIEKYEADESNTAFEYNGYGLVSKIVSFKRHCMGFTCHYSPSGVGRKA